jgi:ribosomal protein S27AE
MNLSCPECGEGDDLAGVRDEDRITVTCGACGVSWDRDPSPRCSKCGGDDLQSVPLAIVEKARGTQLSVVGTRTIHLCSACDADALDGYHRNRPNPLMPDELPTIGPST